MRSIIHMAYILSVTQPRRRYFWGSQLRPTWPSRSRDPYPSNQTR